MNIAIRVYDIDEKRIMPVENRSWYNRYDGYKVKYFLISGTVDTPEQARELAKFFQIMEESLRK